MGGSPEPVSRGHFSMLALLGHNAPAVLVRYLLLVWLILVEGSGWFSLLQSLHESMRSLGDWPLLLLSAQC